MLLSYAKYAFGYSRCSNWPAKLPSPVNDDECDSFCSFLISSSHFYFFKLKISFLDSFFNVWSFHSLSFSSHRLRELVRLHINACNQITRIDGTNWQQMIVNIKSTDVFKSCWKLRAAFNFFCFVFIANILFLFLFTSSFSLISKCI